ncbi:hypothetical protein PBI_SCTP2_252 [Salicola phage SCTP-2]|nr:hypothetical protein PBI_SCTP2_252 [Salicola phage SCTP-2]
MRIESDFQDYYDHCYDLGIINDENITLKRYKQPIDTIDVLNHDMIKSYAITYSYFFPKKQRLLAQYKMRHTNYHNANYDIMTHYGWDGYFLMYLSGLNCYIDTFHKNPHLRSMLYIVGLCDYLYTCVRLPEIYYDRKINTYYIVYDTCYYINNKRFSVENPKETIYKLKKSVNSVEKLFDEQFYYFETKQFVNHFNTLIKEVDSKWWHNLPFVKNKRKRYDELYIFRFISKSPRYHSKAFEDLNTSSYYLKLDYKNNHWQDNSSEYDFGSVFPKLLNMNFNNVMEDSTVYKNIYEYVTK